MNVVEDTTHDIVYVTEVDGVPADGTLLPAPPRARRRRLLRIGIWSAQAVLALVALGLLAIPFGAVWHLHGKAESVGPQKVTPPAVIAGADVARWTAAAAALPANAPPVVICYHDIRPDSTDPYVVSPEEFDRQLTALEAAGYRTMSTSEYAGYLHGGAVPPRSVYLTFDDGTGGLWTYADPVLERHHAHAASYLISGRIDTRQPYYLTWGEVARLAGSGRWDFQAHTHDLHSRVVHGPDGGRGSLLTNLLYDKSSGHLESQSDYEKRVSSDFDALFADFARHGLPKPQFFAYPFSEITDPSNSQIAVEYTQRLVGERFDAAFTNNLPSAAPTSRRASATGVTGRVEVYAQTVVDDLVNDVVSWTAFDPAGDQPLNHPSRWRDDWNGAALTTLAGFTGAGATPSEADSYTYAAYAPYASADWSSYVVSADAIGMQTAKVGVSVFVRVGSDTPLVVRVSRSFVELLSIAGGENRVLAQKPLASGPTHHIEVTVTGAATVVVIDQVEKLQVASQDRPGTSGGIALAIRRGDPKLDHAAFANLTLAATPH